MSTPMDINKETLKMQWQLWQLRKRVSKKKEAEFIADLPNIYTGKSFKKKKKYKTITRLSKRVKKV